MSRRARLVGAVTGAPVLRRARHQYTNGDTAVAGGPDPWRRVAQSAVVAALVCAVLTVMPGPLDSEAFAVGREFGFQLFVAIATAALFARDTTIGVAPADLLMAAYAALAWISLWHAEVRVLGWRDLGLSMATAGMWFAVRHSSERFRTRVLVWSIVLLGLAVAAVSWCEALGWMPGLSEFGRAPGGVFGNRNRMAHVLALCLPATLVLLVRSKRALPRCLAFVTVAVVIGMIVVSRSRAGWIGALIAVASLALFSVPGRARDRDSAAMSRWLPTGAALLLGIGMAFFVPTRLHWRSSQPYRDTLGSLLAVTSGSGSVRVLQQRTTFDLIRHSPVLGVGPGNWQITYGHYAAAGDPSYVATRNVPTSRLPHGDWVGIAAQLGVPACVALMCFFLVNSAALLRRVTDRSSPSPECEGRLELAAGIATIAAVVIMGSSDPVLLTPAPAAITMALVAAWTPSENRWAFRVSSTNRAMWLAAVIILLGRPLVSAARQCYGDYLRRTATSDSDLARAARWNPADFLSRMMMSERTARRGDCRSATAYAVEAYRLFPTSRAPLYVFTQCNVISPRSPRT